MQAGDQYLVASNQDGVELTIATKALSDLLDLRRISLSKSVGRNRDRGRIKKMYLHHINLLSQHCRLAIYMRLISSWLRWSTCATWPDSITLPTFAYDEEEVPLLKVLLLFVIEQCEEAVARFFLWSMG